LNIIQGKVVYKGVSDAFNLPLTPLENLLN